MASPHAAGALALLASYNNPGSAADVGNLYNQLIGIGKLNWIDDSGDGIKAPLLDVSTITSVSMTSGGSGGGNSNPTVTITDPVDGQNYSTGTSITLSSTTSDPEVRHGVGPPACRADARRCLVR